MLDVNFHKTLALNLREAAPSENDRDMYNMYVKLVLPELIQW